MPYLLDTNVVIRHLDGDLDTRALVRNLTPDGIAVSTVTQMEVWEGVYRASDPQTLAAEYQEFFDSIVVIPFDSAIAKRGARLRHDLRQHSTRTRERALDLQIAATALHHRLELVTYNDRDYDDIVGLTRHPI
jgi:predicted nucleic acid-binding protein